METEPPSDKKGNRGLSTASTQPFSAKSAHLRGPCITNGPFHQPLTARAPSPPLLFERQELGSKAEAESFPPSSRVRALSLFAAQLPAVGGKHQSLAQETNISAMH